MKQGDGTERPIDCGLVGRPPDNVCKFEPRPVRRKADPLTDEEISRLRQALNGMCPILARTK